MASKGYLRLAIVAVGLLIMTLVGAACGTAAEPTAPPTKAPAVVATPTPTATVPVPASPVSSGKLTIMVGGFGTERFDRVFAPGGEELNYYRLLAGQLIDTNEKTELIPGIASRWSLSADGLTWTFTIRKGVKFHDGSELTPEDVVWTLQHAFGPQAFEYATQGAMVTLSRAMDKIELSGPDEVRVTTKTPFTAFLANVSEAGVVAVGVMLKRAKLHDAGEEAAYDKNPIGAGVMKLNKHDPGYRMTFERFGDYYYQSKNGFPEDRRVNFQSLEMFLVPEEATRVAALRARDADIVPVSIQTRKQVEAGGGRLVFGQEAGTVMVVLEGCDEQPQYPCHDKRVRQALDYAIDKELMRDRLFGGREVFQTKGWAAVSPSTIGYSPGLDPRPFDPTKARQLLADAGYPGGKGFGTLIINASTSSNLPLLPESAQLAADSWRELGLEVKVNVTDRSTLIANWKADKLWGQILWSEWASTGDAVNHLAREGGNPKSDTGLHKDPELQGLVQGTLRMVNAGEQAKALAETYLRLRDESYEIGVGYFNIPWAVGPRVVAWRPYPLANYPTALHTITLK